MLGRVAVRTESKDPGMLEEATDQRADADSVGKAGHAGAQGTETAHDQVDLGACLGCRVERLDDFGVDEAVDLEDDAATARPGCLPLDHADDVRAQAHGGHQQPAESTLTAVASQEVEQLGHVCTELGIRRQQADVLIDLRGLGIVVAGADVYITADAVGLSPNDERDFGMRLEPADAIDDVDAHLLELLGPGDVRLFVTARLQFDERHDLLAALGRADQRTDDRTHWTGGPIKRLLNGQDVGRLGRLVDKGFRRGGERVIRVMDEDVAILEGLEDVGLLHSNPLQPPLGDWSPWLALEIRTVERVDGPEAAQVEQAVDAVDVRWFELELADEQAEHFVGHSGIDFESDDLGLALLPA